jgi:thiamine biosynthesis protein ThiI
MQTKPKALLLISGGIDSPVAGKLALEKGYDLEAIHFSQEPFTDDSPKIKSLLLCKLLGLKEMIVVNCGEELKEIADNSYREYYFILMKRFMLKVSEKIAEQKKCEYLITGESLGQVSSQTLSNLNTINQSTKMEILRPLLFMNKQEIINLSTKHGYFNTSKGPEMCDALATGKPKTRSEETEVKKQEEHCEMEKLVQNAVKKIRIENTAKEIKTTNKIIELCK